MANRLNAGDKQGFIKYLTKSIIIICLFLIPITFGMLFLSKEIVTVFYERGKFDSSAVVLTSMALFGYSLQLPFAGIRDILNSSLFSMKKTKVTTINGIIGVVINIALSIILSKYMGVLGIAIATSVSSLVIALLLLNSTKEVVGSFNISEVIIKISKIILSSTLMILILYFINSLLSIENSFIIILTDGSLGAVIFMIMCKILKIEEFNEALNMIKMKFKKEG